MTEQNYELAWTADRIRQKIEALTEEIKHLPEFTQSQKDDIDDATQLMLGEL